MNFSDSEIVASILEEEGFGSTKDIKDAGIILINTCSIRDHAEQRIRKRLEYMQSLKKKNPRLIIGMLGCMAERLKTQLLEEEKMLDLIAGPDSYRDLPRLVAEVESGKKAVNTLLSIDETYADISPVRYDSNGISAFISIMRGVRISVHIALCLMSGDRSEAGMLLPSPRKPKLFFIRVSGR